MNVPQVRLLAAVLAVAFAMGACTPAQPTPEPTMAVTPTPPAPATPTTEPATPTPEPATPTPAASTPAPSPTAAVIGVEGRIVNLEDGYAITLPSGWRRIDLAAGDLDALLAAIEDPELREQLRAPIETAILSGIKIMAFRSADLGTGFATNVNVISAPAMGLSLGFIEQINVTQIEQIPGLEGEVDSERVTLPAGEAVRLRYRLSEDQLGDNYAVDQYLLLAGGNMHVVTVSGADAEDIEGDAESMAQSFELLD